MDYFSLNVLRDWSVVELAKTGDATKQMLLYEAGLCSKNEKASGILAIVRRKKRKGVGQLAPFFYERT